MNIKELIEKYKVLEENLFDFGARIACQLFLQDLEKLDEPEKVKVPQFVAEWIEYTKDEDYHLRGAMSLENFNEAPNKAIFADWFYTDDNMEIFARAWLDGYEVEKEKRYFVKVRGMLKGFEFLTFKFGHVWIFSSEEEDEEFRLYHTSKQLEEAGFGWVFDCPGFEIEEVE